MFIVKIWNPEFVKPFRQCFNQIIFNRSPTKSFQIQSAAYLMISRIPKPKFKDFGIILIKIYLLIRFWQSLLVYKAAWQLPDVCLSPDDCLTTAFFVFNDFKIVKDFNNNSITIEIQIGPIVSFVSTFLIICTIIVHDSIAV